MDLTEHIAFLRTDGMLLADAAEVTGLEPQVPSCPEWTVRDLVRHVGVVHRWARSHVADALAALNQEYAEPPAADEELLAWFREGHALLLHWRSHARVRWS